MDLSLSPHGAAHNAILLELSMLSCDRPQGELCIASAQAAFANVNLE